MEAARSKRGARKASGPVGILTIGHSTRSIEEFLKLLEAHTVTRVADVRTVPRSRHNPQFDKEALARSLKKAGLGYDLLPGLGGLRHPKRDSVNTGWRNKSFRGYADYMQTPQFQQSLEELIVLAKRDRIAVMCAEAVPWRCHRSLIADALAARGIKAEHIMSATRRTVHSLTPFAQVNGMSIVYPGGELASSKDIQQKGTRAMKKSKRQNFNYSAHGATSVLLVGDFTNWQEHPISMRKGKGDIWTATVELSPGQHHYRFIVDGEWRDDPECTVRVANPYGSEDMIAQVAA